MAKVVEDTQRVVATRWWNGSESVLVGGMVGALWWLVTALIIGYIFDEPRTAGAVAAVLVAIFGTTMLLRYRIPRALLVVVSSAVVLWLLGAYLDGLVWYVALLWSAGLYGLAYGVFTLVAHIRFLWLSILSALAIVLASGVLLELL